MKILYEPVAVRYAKISIRIFGLFLAHAAASVKSVKDRRGHAIDIFVEKAEKPGYQVEISLGREFRKKVPRVPVPEKLKL